MTRIMTITRVVWLEMVRRKDIYVLLILLLAFLITLMSLNIFGLSNLVGFVKEIGLLMVWIFGWILAVNISTRQLPREETRGTIFQLLAKPITRAEVVVGKWLGAWSISSAAVIVFYAVLVLVVCLRGGIFCWIALAQGLALHICMLGVISALGMMFSTRLTYDASASMTYVVSIAAFLVLPRVPDLTVNVEGWQRTGLLVLYYIMPHFELFDMRLRLVHNWDPAHWETILLVLVYGFVVIGIFLLLAWLAYRGKQFSRGVVQ